VRDINYRLIIYGGARVVSLGNFPSGTTSSALQINKQEIILLLKITKLSAFSSTAIWKFQPFF